MNKEQMETVEKMTNPVVVDAKIMADGKALNGVKAVLSIPYTSTRLVRAWYAAGDGTKKAVVKYKKLRKKKQTILINKLMKISDARGTVTFKKLSGSKNFIVNKKTGKVTIKKGTKKGIYKIKIKVTAAGCEDYAAGEKIVKVKVRVR